MENKLKRGLYLRAIRGWD